MFIFNLQISGNGYAFQETYETGRPMQISAIIADLCEITVFGWQTLGAIEILDRSIRTKTIKLHFNDNLATTNGFQIFDYFNILFLNISNYR